jgi:hypothetical protein
MIIEKSEIMRVIAWINMTQKKKRRESGALERLI